MGEKAIVQFEQGRHSIIGSGPPLVILASPLARGVTYRPTAAALARHFRVITVEFPDIRSTRGWTVEEHTRWAAAIIAELGVERSLVVGHSYTGAVAVLLAARHPELIGGLVVVDSIGAGRQSIPRSLAGMANDTFREGDIVAERWPDTIGQFVKSPRQFLRLVWESLTLDVLAEAGEVKVPTLVAWGSGDRTIHPRNAGKFAAAIPGVKVYFSERGGHAWPVTRPGEFAVAVKLLSVPYSLVLV